MVLTVNSVDSQGHIKAIKKSKSKKTEFNLPANFGNFDYAYCSTSYSAQGKTVDHVLINQPSTTFPASNQKQFYVSVSRGREGVKIYTDDKESLLAQIQKSGDRIGATELIKDGD
jgi:ATP-dependent exoDNAse (exonuclease V) alpha subunit